MELGSHDTVKGSYDGCSTTEILTGLRADVRGRETLLIDEWVGIVAWADQNVVATPEQAATILDGVVDTGVPIAGPGAPLVSEFALMELIAVLGRSPDGGRAYVGRVIECAWRLPCIYDAVVSGRTAPWRAERIADLTRALVPDAAAFVDRQLAGLGGVSWAQIERCVAEAIIRFDPDQAEADRNEAAEHRHATVEPVDQINGNGLVRIEALVDALDGHDLNEALARRARLRGRLGDADSLDVRRSKALGDIARGDLELDLLIPDPVTGEVIGKVPGRKTVLNVHLTPDQITPDPANPVARCEQVPGPVTIAQVRAWLGDLATTSIVVRPVIDLADCLPVEAWEIPDRHRQSVELRDHTCRFPHCTKPAARCDLDHTIEHNKGGPTCPCNLVPVRLQTAPSREDVQ